MVPAGKITDMVLAEAASVLQPGDIVIDGGNSKFTDSQRHYAELKAKGIHFLDAGTSGGIWGLKEGYCLMVGGDEDAYKTVEPLLLALAPEGGLLHTGPAGSGHYVKMVHNGIEYAMMQSYGEGFEILKASPYPDLDLHAICELWRHGSVVRSWLLDLAADAFAKDPNLDQITGYVDDSGEGRWTVMESIEHAVPAPVIALSLYLRFRSRQADSFSAKVLAALRNEFGGHAVHHDAVDGPHVPGSEAAGAPQTEAQARSVELAMLPAQPDVCIIRIEQQPEHAKEHDFMPSSTVYTWGLLALVGVLLAGDVAVRCVRAEPPQTTPKSIAAQEFRLTDAQGNTRATFGPRPDGSAGLTFVDKQGKRRATMGVTDAGESSIVFYDTNGKIRADLAVLPDGNAGLLLLDKSEQTRLLGPPALGWKPRSSAQRQRGQKPRRPSTRPPITASACT